MVHRHLWRGSRWIVSLNVIQDKCHCYPSQRSGRMEGVALDLCAKLRPLCETTGDMVHAYSAYDLPISPISAAHVWQSVADFWSWIVRSELFQLP